MKPISNERLEILSEMAEPTKVRYSDGYSSVEDIRGMAKELLEIRKAFQELYNRCVAPEEIIRLKTKLEELKHG